MKENNGLWEYVATYVDDLCLVMKDPEAFLKILQSEPYSFKLKGSGPFSFHLGCGFSRDKHGVLSMEPKECIEKMINRYERMFGIKPCTKYTSPLDKRDHSELDTSEFLSNDNIYRNIRV